MSKTVSVGTFYTYQSTLATPKNNNRTHFPSSLNVSSIEAPSLVIHEPSEKLRVFAVHPYCWPFSAYYYVLSALIATTDNEDRSKNVWFDPA